MQYLPELTLKQVRVVQLQVHLAASLLPQDNKFNTNIIGKESRKHGESLLFRGKQTICSSQGHNAVSFAGSSIRMKGTKNYTNLFITFHYTYIYIHTQCNYTYFSTEKMKPQIMDSDIGSTLPDDNAELKNKYCTWSMLVLLVYKSTQHFKKQRCAFSCINKLFTSFSCILISPSKLKKKYCDN